MDLPMGSDNAGIMQCPSLLTVCYFYCSGKEITTFSIQESEIFPKIFF